jgi:hypothetical protein
MIIKKSIKKIAAVDAANKMLAALDLTAEDYEKIGNLEASYQVDLARHYLKKAVEEGELDGVEVPESILEEKSADEISNDTGDESLSGNLPNLKKEDVKEDDEVKASKDEKIENLGMFKLRAFDYGSVEYTESRRERLASLAKRSRV